MDVNGTDLITIPSSYSVDEIVSRLTQILVEKNIKLFTVIDHSGEAEAAGLSMPNTKLVIFGNPRGGTPLMLASPGVAIDLPLKLLIAEDNEGRVTLSYNAPGYLGKRHGLPQELLKNIAVIEILAHAAAE